MVLTGWFKGNLSRDVVMRCWFLLTIQGACPWVVKSRNPGQPALDVFNENGRVALTLSVIESNYGEKCLSLSSVADVRGTG